MGGTQVECEEHTCAFRVDGRCIAKHVSMVMYSDEDSGLKGLTCDTYEHRDSWIPGEPDDFDDEQWADDWHVGREDGR